MRLLLVRHARAVPRGAPGMADQARPLTPRGVRLFERAARGLRAILPAPDVILTSPMLRARATADLLATAWGGPEPTPSAALLAGDVAALERSLRAQRERRLVALVGHEPHLSALLAQLLGGARPEALEFRKGGAALIEMDDSREGRLIFCLPPRLLRRLGR